MRSARVGGPSLSAASISPPTVRRPKTRRAALLMVILALPAWDEAASLWGAAGKTLD